MKLSVVLLVLFGLFAIYGALTGFSYISTSKIFTMSSALFSFEVGFLLFPLFLGLMLINLFSMAVYSYPISTTLSFNLSAAFTCWTASVLLQSSKSFAVSSILPSNAPWYLIPFLCVVELISVLVRPLTLCFRLLANMVAGHVLIALICKMSYVWVLGSMFGVLELAVAVVQAFVFSMLVSVYLEESLSH